MQASSLPVAGKQHIDSHQQAQHSMGVPGGSPSDYDTVTNSWATTYSWSSLSADRDGPPLAWVGIRHQILDEDKEGEDTAIDDRSQSHCRQAVLLTCLYLSHEMTLREVGLYAWYLPYVKDPSGSTMKIMKRYAQQLQDLSSSPLNVRQAPDPSRLSIQHNLQKARLAAGPEGYVAVLYCGHGIQEPPTKAGELWCYDRSFEECVQQGGGPSEYIPILLFDVLTWAGASTCYVWDSQHAGRFLRSALTEAEEIDTQLRAAAVQNPAIADLHPAIYSRRQIHFAACGAHEILPRVPGMPDDLFTACLTTPLRIALLHHNLQTFPLTTSDSAKYTQRSARYMAAFFDHMSTELKERLASELLAIVHTIAWQSLDGVKYQMLFGKSGDVVFGLAGGFLLSQRVMSAYHAHPESIPYIPSSTSHALWTTWDLILDNLFEQLPPYFDDEYADWESGLKLVSFMDDQLNSILESDRPLLDAASTSSRQSKTAHSKGSGLSRLPIICKAALTPKFRNGAITALDNCLRHLDVRGIAHALQGGALDVAAQLLDVKDDAIATRMISIWSSLIRHESCVSSLADDGRTAERLTGLPAVQFFLDALEKHLPKFGNEARRAVCQTAAVLATIANHVSGRSAPRYIQRTLTLGSNMISGDDGLVAQWGSFLVAEVLDSLHGAKDDADVQDLMAEIQIHLFEMIKSSTVENRAAAVFSLVRWIERQPVDDLVKTAPSLDLTLKIVPHCRTDGSGLVRKSIVRFLNRALLYAGKWTTLVLWLHLCKQASSVMPGRRTEIDRVSAQLCSLGGKEQEHTECLAKLTTVFEAYTALREDPNPRVADLVKEQLRIHLGALEPFVMEEEFSRLAKEVFADQWNDDAVDILVMAGEQSTLFVDDKEFFERSKISLQAYLAREEAPQKSPEQLTGRPESATDRGYAARFRQLEDSFVVAEQQVGLPWKWEMNKVTCAEPWSTITFHSFLPTAMACTGTQDLLTWDWSDARKRGKVRLDLPPGATITSTRFVNELFERIVVCAEISNGAIHVLSAPSSEPTKAKTISSFHALDMGPKAVLANVLPKHNRLVCTWWRQSGKLAAGGPSNVINVWDCPAERCCRVLGTDSRSALTTLITEPASGNILIGGFAKGMVKLWDTRQSRPGPLMSWAADTPPCAPTPIPASAHTTGTSGHWVKGKQGIAKLGVVLGQSSHVTSACFNGLVQIHDLRKTDSPCSSILAHPLGISSASFQAHSGLMSTSSLIPSPSNSASAPATKVGFGLYRSNQSSLVPVTEEILEFEPQQPSSPHPVVHQFQPYTVTHNLRPFLGVGYGTNLFLRGVGVGKGDDTDSGSYSFLRNQTAMLNNY